VSCIQAGFAFQGAFPDRGNAPARRQKGRNGPLVIRDVPVDFGSPELLAGPRPLEQMAIMVMPEAAVHKNNGFVFWEYEVWFAWEVAVMQAVSKTCRMHRFPYLILRFRMAAFNSGHIFAARSLVVNVRQIRRLSSAASFSRQES
jgi:hypothetical protein